MALRSAKEEADAWIQLNNQFVIVQTKEEDDTLHFRVKSVTFYIRCPGENDTDWFVWSDQEDGPIIEALGQVIESLDGRSTKRITVTQVLEKIKKGLQPLIATEAEGNDNNEEEEEYEEDIDDNYYEEDDKDAKADTAGGSNKITLSDEENDDLDRQFMGQGSPVAAHRLLKDLKNMKDAKGKFGVVGEPRGDNLFIWDVKLTDFPKDSRLGKDLENFAKQYNREPVVYLEMKFPQEFPMAPPFVRVIRPRLKFLTGHVTIGGSICMELLTRSGWRPTNDIESILVQIRAEITSDPNARLDPKPDNPYTEEEARFAFQRMVQKYNWE